MSDFIRINISGDKDLIDSVNQNLEFFKNQILAKEVIFDDKDNEFDFEELMGTDSIIEGDHQEARDSGNETSKSNLVLRKKRANIRKSNKQIIN